MNLAAAAVVFGIVLPAELPDKTALASLVLGSRYNPRYVFAGVAAGFAVHVGIALAAGSLLALLPHRPVEIVVAALFLGGAVLLLRRARDGGGEVDEQEYEHRIAPERLTSGWRIAATSFGLIFLAEFGDLTQILTANLAAHYHDPLAVGVGAVLALWTVGGLAILGGRRLQRFLSLTWIARVAAVAMIVLAGFSIVGAIQG